VGLAACGSGPGLKFCRKMGQTELDLTSGGPGPLTFNQPKALLFRDVLQSTHWKFGIALSDCELMK